MTTNEKIEQLALKVCGQFYEGTIGKGKNTFFVGMRKNSCMRVARMIYVMFLEARIDEVMIARLTNGHSTNNMIRMQELEQQLLEIRS